MGFIDAHVHVWTADLAHYPIGTGWKAADMQPRSFTPDELFKHTRQAGVDRVNLIQMSYYYPSDLSSRKENSFDNRYMLDMIALYKNTFVGTAVIDPLAKQPEKVMADMAKREVRAFRILPRLSKLPPAKWLQPEGYARMFAAGAKNNQAMSCLIDPDALPELDRMCQKYPDTPVIIDHLARIGVGGKIRNEDVKALCAMARHKKVMVKVGAFYALGKGQAPYTDLEPLIRDVVKAFTPRRCMWESDCPFQVQNKHTYLDSINLIRNRLKFLTAQDKEWILRRTAEDFFFAKK